MSTTELLTVTTQVFFILLGGMAAIDFFYHRDAVRRDVALMFWSVSFPVFTGFVFGLTDTPIPFWLSIANGFALSAQPYMLLRLVRYFRPIPLKVEIIAVLGMFGLWMTILLFPDEIPPFINLIVIAYFVLVNCYSVMAFVRGAVRTSGVTRQRLRFVASGSGLLAFALLLLGVRVIIPEAASFIPLIAIASAIMYYIGFAPPRWLRRTWQFSEVNDYLTLISNKPVSERVNAEKNLTELCYVANHAVGGMAAGIAQRNKHHNWTLNYKVGELAELPLSVDETLNHIWENGQSDVIQNDSFNRTVGADTLLVVPIRQRERPTALLLVFLKYGSLFIDDDLHLVTLLAKQSATFLENSEMVEQLHTYSEQLGRTLELTEALYDTSHHLLLSKTYDQSLNAVLRYASKANASAVSLFTIGTNDLGKPEWITSIASVGTLPALRQAVGTRYPLKDFLFMNHWLEAPNQALLIEDVSKDTRFDQPSRDLTLQLGIQAAAILPLVVDGAWLGVLTINWSEPHPFSEFAPQFYGALASLFATVLETERMRQAEQEALTQLAATNRELEAFSYSVSHDLRTPLRSLDGFSQVLLEDYADVLDEEGKNHLERIRLASQRMGELIDDLLNLSRLSRAEMRVDEVNLSELAQQIAEELRQRNRQPPVEFTIAPHIVVRGDARLLRIALFNLLDNAWKFTGKTPNPHIEFGVLSGNTYFVRDNGAGFEMAYVNKLFGAFQRLHHTTDFDGTGVGLAIVQRIIHRHGGHIRAEGAVDEGATFYFTL